MEIKASRELSLESARAIKVSTVMYVHCTHGRGKMDL